jgi:DNA/RNA-binding domain of Phe-tRNA-synthetase-like protein
MSGGTTGITALDWVTNSTVADEVHERWPDYRAILVATDRVDLDHLATAADHLFTEAQAAAREVDTSDPDEHIARWHHAYRDFGVKPRVARVSVDALIRRAASDNGLPRISTLVDLYNAVSIIHRVPIGGEDLEHYDGPARLIVASGEEPFRTTEHGEPVIDHPDPGEPAWIDGSGVTCRRWNWRQTNRTAITQHTLRVGFIIDSLDAPNHVGARGAAEQLAELLPEAHTRTL